MKNSEIVFESNQVISTCCQFSEEKGLMDKGFLNIHQDEAKIEKKFSLKSYTKLMQGKTSNSSSIIGLAALDRPTSTRINYIPFQACPYRSEIYVSSRLNQNEYHPNQFQKSRIDKSIKTQESGVMFKREGWRKLDLKLKDDKFVQLSETTKRLGNRLEDEGGQQLKKTVKHTIIGSQLGGLRESVFSVISEEKGPRVERLEQSQIMINFFHPPENRLKEIEQYVDNHY